jgi:hypothetical protein
MTSFLITFKPAKESPKRGRSLKNLQQLVQRHRTGVRVTEPWRFHNRKEVCHDGATDEHDEVAGTGRLLKPKVNKVLVMDISDLLSLSPREFEIAVSRSLARMGYQTGNEEHRDWGGRGTLARAGESVALRLLLFPFTPLYDSLNLKRRWWHRYGVVMFFVVFIVIGLWLVLLTADYIWDHSPYAHPDRALGATLGFIALLGLFYLPQIAYRLLLYIIFGSIRSNKESST